MIRYYTNHLQSIFYFHWSFAMMLLYLLFPLTTTENPLMLDSLPHFFSSSIVVILFPLSQSFSPSGVIYASVELSICCLFAV